LTESDPFLRQVCQPDRSPAPSHWLRDFCGPGTPAIKSIVLIDFTDIAHVSICRSILTAGKIPHKTSAISSLRGSLQVRGTGWCASTCSLKKPACSGLEPASSNLLIGICYFGGGRICLDAPPCHRLARHLTHFLPHSKTGPPLWVRRVFQLRRNLVGFVEFCVRFCFISFLL
jgi:hypothetical protein